MPDRLNPRRPARTSLLRRVAQLRASREGESAVGDADRPAEQPAAHLEQRIAHLEDALEGLQDAMHRQAVRQDERIARLEKQAQPAFMRRSLSEDARRHGL